MSSRGLVSRLGDASDSLEVPGQPGRGPSERRDAQEVLEHELGQGAASGRHEVEEPVGVALAPHVAMVEAVGRAVLLDRIDGPERRRPVRQVVVERAGAGQHPVGPLVDVRRPARSSGCPSAGRPRIPTTTAHARGRCGSRLATTIRAMISTHRTATVTSESASEASASATEFVRADLVGDLESECPLVRRRQFFPARYHVGSPLPSTQPYCRVSSPINGVRHLTGGPDDRSARTRCRPARNGVGGGAWATRSRRRARSAARETPPCSGPTSVDLEYFVAPPRPFTMRRCGSCGSQFLGPRPTEEELPPFYPSDYHAYNENHGALQQLLVRYRARSRARFYGGLMRVRPGQALRRRRRRLPPLRRAAALPRRRVRRRRDPARGGGQGPGARLRHHRGVARDRRSHRVPRTSTTWCR